MYCYVMGTGIYIFIFILVPGKRLRKAITKVQKAARQKQNSK